MAPLGRIALASVAVVAAITLAVPSRAAAQAEPAAPVQSAAQASPELVGALSKELGATPDQAAGAAGALLGIAKSRLSADEFAQVSNAVPGADVLLKAAPMLSGPIGTSGALSSVGGLGGSAQGLASAAAAFSKLGLSSDAVAKAVPVLTSFVTKSGGANVGSLLAGALK